MLPWHWPNFRMDDNDWTSRRIAFADTKQLWSQTPLKSVISIEKSAENVHEGLGLELSFYFNSPFPQRLWGLEMMILPLNADASFARWSGEKRKNGSGTRSDLLLWALSRWLHCRGSLFENTQGAMYGIVQKEGNVSICFATFCENFLTCFLKVHRNASLDHLPMSMIVYTGNPARYIYITSPEQRKRVPILLCLKLRWALPITVEAAVLSSLVRARGNCLTKKIKEVRGKNNVFIFRVSCSVPFICTLGELCGLLQLNWWVSRLKV